MIPVRINANIKTMTVDEIMGQKKAMHLASFRFLIDELRRDLERVAEERDAQGRWERDESKTWVAEEDGAFMTVASARQLLLAQCEEVHARHGLVPADAYSSDETVRFLVNDMLECKGMAMHKFLLWLEDPNERIVEVFHGGNFVGTVPGDGGGCGFGPPYSLRQAHRLFLGLLARQVEQSAGEAKQAAALRLCRAKGLVREDPNERNEVDEPLTLARMQDGVLLDDLKLLLQAKADPNPVLGLAAQTGRADFVRSLCLHGGVATGAALESAVDSWNRIYRPELSFDTREAFGALIECKADIDWADEFGFTVLHRAMEAYSRACNDDGRKISEDLVLLLIRAGAKVDVENCNGDTPEVPQCILDKARPSKVIDSERTCRNDLEVAEQVVEQSVERGVAHGRKGTNVWLISGSVKSEEPAPHASA